MEKPKDQVIIRDLSVSGIIGVYEHERHTPQAICINIIMYTDIQAAGEKDDITLSVDYAQVTTKVKAHAENAAPLTVEALATQIAGICLDTPLVSGVRVRVEKPDAIPEAAGVGIEIERWN